MRWNLLFLLFLSCSDYTSYYNHPESPDNEIGSETRFSTFATRLSNNLFISGKSCIGDETTDSQGSVFTCEAGQWLVVVDTVNFCTPVGCTQIVVRPFIASLLDQSRSGETRFFQIAPAIPVNSEILSVLESVLLRFNGSELPAVVFR